VPISGGVDNYQKKRLRTARNIRIQHVGVDWKNDERWGKQGKKKQGGGVVGAG